jgi:hypothetical protein
MTNPNSVTRDSGGWCRCTDPGRVVPFGPLVYGHLRPHKHTTRRA